LDHLSVVPAPKASTALEPVFPEAYVVSPQTKMRESSADKQHGIANASNTQSGGLHNQSGDFNAGLGGEHASSGMSS
jgi:hypothetical protein